MCDFALGVVSLPVCSSNSFIQFRVISPCGRKWPSDDLHPALSGTSIHKPHRPTAQSCLASFYSLWVEIWPWFRSSYFCSALPCSLHIYAIRNIKFGFPETNMASNSLYANTIQLNMKAVVQVQRYHIDKLQSKPEFSLFSSLSPSLCVNAD